MGFVVTWLLLAALWIGLSGYFDPVHLIFGFCSVTLVSLISHPHLTGGGDVLRGIGRMVRLVLYLPWLIWQIVVANVDVTLRILGFRDIDPRVVRFRPDLSSDFGRVTLANSITLTPGTVTVLLQDGEYVIHALSREAADAVLAGTMARKAAVVEGSAAPEDDRSA